jgi:hypothetical protein
MSVAAGSVPTVGACYARTQQILRILVRAWPASKVRVRQVDSGVPLRSIHPSGKPFPFWRIRHP